MVPGREFNHLEKILHNLGLKFHINLLITKVYLHDKYSLKIHFIIYSKIKFILIIFMEILI